MFFSPTGFPSRMLKKSTSGVLASFRSSTGTQPPHQLGGAHNRGALYSSSRAPSQPAQCSGWSNQAFWLHLKRFCLDQICFSFAEYSAAAYSAEVATSTTKAGSYGVFGEGESMRDER